MTSSEITSAEILEARQQARRIFANLAASHSRPVLLWLCSLMRRWESDEAGLPERSSPTDNALTDAVLDAAVVDVV